jgi:hypothetical protein
MYAFIAYMHQDYSKPFCLLSPAISAAAGADPKSAGVGNPADVWCVLPNSVALGRTT